MSKLNQEDFQSICKVLDNLKWYLDYNEECGVVYFPRCIVEKDIQRLKEVYKNIRG